MRTHVGVLSVCAAVSLLTGCFGDGENSSHDETSSATSGAGTNSEGGAAEDSEDSTGDSSTLDGAVAKEIGEVGGAFCDTNSAGDPKDWDCEVNFTVTGVTVGDTCSALGFDSANTHFEPEQTLIRVDTDLEFAPDASHDATLFTAMANWEVVDGDGYSSPLSSVSDCVPAFSGNNTWSSPNQAGRKYHRTTLMTLPTDATALTLNVINQEAAWEWELPSGADDAGSGSAGKNGPEPTSPAASV